MPFAGDEARRGRSTTFRPLPPHFAWDFHTTSFDRGRLVAGEDRLDPPPSCEPVARRRQHLANHEAFTWPQQHLIAWAPAWFSRVESAGGFSVDAHELKSKGHAILRSGAGIGINWP